MREVRISAVLNGWVATVGCQTLVYDDADELVHDLREYMADPAKKEMQVLKDAKNKYLVCREQLQANPGLVGQFRDLGLQLQAQRRSYGHGVRYPEDGENVPQQERAQ